MTDQQINEQQAIAQFVHEPRYQHQVAQALDAAVARIRDEEVAAGVRTLDPATDRYIIFSDLHRGARNGADDFLRCERTYNAALAYYFKMGYTLITLGDVEELWEERPEDVVRAYEHSLELEAQFHQRERYVRVWGNHDEDWSSAADVERLLQPVFGGEPLNVREGLRLRVMDAGQHLGDLLLVHGHQGDVLSYQWAKFSRWVVRRFWRTLQRLTRFSLNTPANDWQLRAKHNIALYKWAERCRKTVLIAGHTHRPVFQSLSHTEKLRRQLAELEAWPAGQDDRRRREAIGHKAAELEWVRAQEYQTPDEETSELMSKPCYFNAGCCCFTDGDITGLELAEGHIRLIRWPDKHDRPRPDVLESKPLRDVLAAC
jgi:UDP-2,3-diacylglucosamine pyrophosphatase LpxH